MSSAPNVAYLLNDQYKNAGNLSARARLHSLFGVNKYGWFNWLFDQYCIPATARILEVGAGTGWQWLENVPRISPGWDITLSDFSAGMVAEARSTLATVRHPIKFQRIDVQAIPYADARFDVVMAHFMLYHVPDRAGAIAELRRVLKPGGILYTATVGNAHLRDLDALIAEFTSVPEYVGGFGEARRYTLENAPLQLAEQFESVEVRRYADALVVTEVEPLIEYVLSMPARDLVGGKRLPAFREFIAAEMAKTGAIRITKDSGLVIATDNYQDEASNQ